jgi:NAD(P)-dependent dehydrogenase (short-subunit alcohol dehydrogenase family)
MTEFAGKVAVVTAGTTGIGKGCALRLAEGGACVVVSSRSEANVEAAVAEARGRGLEVDGMAADAGRSADVQGLIAFTIRRFGGVDILVNNAGIGTFGSVVDMAEDDWHAALATNLDSVFFASKYAIPAMKARAGGAIVNISSVHGLATMGPRIAYTTTKTAILGMTRAMALNHAADGILVNAVCPGPTETPMLHRSWTTMFLDTPSSKTLAAQGKKLPLGRIGQPADIAEAVAFLASDRAAFITGTHLPVDGGLLAMLALTPPEIS